MRVIATYVVLFNRKFKHLLQTDDGWFMEMTNKQGQQELRLITPDQASGLRFNTHMKRKEIIAKALTEKP